MGMWLRQSTASQEMLLGPFLDSTDGNTPETELTIANTDIKLWKEGATTEANKNSGGATHIAGGRYYAVLDATDTDTLGKLEVNCHPTGALAVRREFMVVPAIIYDNMILGTAAYPLFGIIDSGTLQSATGTTAVLRSALSLANDIVNGATIHITGGTGAGQTRLITDFVGSSDTVTVDTWTTNPDNTSTYVIYATPQASSSLPVTATLANGVTHGGSSAVLSLNHVTISTSTASTPGISIHATGTGNSHALQLQSTSGQGLAVGSVNSFGASINSTNADDLQIGGVVFDNTELMQIVDDLIDAGRLDALIDAIKAKTDSLTFTVAGVVDANVQRVNDVAITGDGSGTPFDVA